MKNKITWKIIGIGVVLLAMLVSVTVITDQRVSELSDAQEITKEISVSLTIDGLYVDKEMTISHGETALRLLEILNREDSRVQLITKKYAGMGILVESIGGLRNGEGGKYWQYTIDGVMPQIGADAVVVKNGDKIEWKFAPSTF